MSPERRKQNVQRRSVEPKQKPSRRQEPELFLQQETEAAALRRAVGAPRPALRPASLLPIQRMAGNRAVTQLLKARGLGQWTTVQAKLTVGPVGDAYEQEADRVAQQVAHQLGEGQSVQRAEPGKEEVRMKPLTEPQGVPVAGELETRIQQARGSGQPLADGVREPMEQAFGADLSGVRVHTDAQSDTLSRSLQARAFTIGQELFFGQGEYDPGSSDGRQLLAHELTHVVQQNSARIASNKAKPRLAAHFSPVPSLSDHSKRLQRWPDEDLKQKNVDPDRIDADITKAQGMVIAHAKEAAQEHDSDALKTLGGVGDMTVTKTATFSPAKSWWKDWLTERPDDWGPHDVEWEYEEQAGRKTNKVDTRRDWHLTMDIDDPLPGGQDPHVGFEMWATVPSGSNKTKLSKKALNGIGHVWVDAVWTGR